MLRPLATDVDSGGSSCLFATRDPGTGTRVERLDDSCHFMQGVPPTVVPPFGTPTC